MSETTSDPGFDESPELEAELQDTAPEAAADTEAAPEPEAAPRAPRQVPLGELMAERERGKQAREEAARLREQFEVGNRRLEQMLQAVQATQPHRAPEPMPDINTDPVGYFQRENAEMKAQLAEVMRERQHQQQQGQAQTQDQRMVDAYRMDAMSFAQKAPDFGQAYNHFKETILREHLETGADPDEAIRELEAQERKIVERAFKAQKSPAELIYKAAERYGFKSAGAKPDGAARMAAMQAGAAASKSTGGPARGANYSGLTVEALANMSESEFARVPDGIVNRLLGKPS